MTDFIFEPEERPTLAILGSGKRFPVRRIYCIGRNYLAHIREMGEADERDPPIFFQKPGDSLVADRAPVFFQARQPTINTKQSSWWRSEPRGRTSMCGTRMRMCSVMPSAWT